MKPQDSTIRLGGTAPPKTALSVQRLTFWHQAEIKHVPFGVTDGTRTR
jgi:hypothetical protein